MVSHIESGAVSTVHGVGKDTPAANCPRGTRDLRVNRAGGRHKHGSTCSTLPTYLKRQLYEILWPRFSFLDLRTQISRLKLVLFFRTREKKYIYQQCRRQCWCNFHRKLCDIFVIFNSVSVPYRHRGGRMKNINSWYLNTHMVYL
jgi:hypothetical protein